MAANDTRLRVMHLASGDLWAGAEVQLTTLVKKIRDHYCLRVVVMNSGRLTQELIDLGVDVAILEETGHHPLSLLLKIRRQLNQFRPHILHTHRQKENVLGSLANLLSVRCHCVRTCHGAPEFHPKGLQRLQVWLDRWCGRVLQDAIIAVSADLKRQLADLYPEQKLWLIHNGIDPDDLPARSLDSDGPDSKAANQKSSDKQLISIGIIGRLEPVKRVDIFLDMAALLYRTHEKRYRFHVIGEGSLKPALERQAQRLGIAGVTQFHGHCDDTPAMIQNLDAIVICSDHEGMPMVALEALAMGTQLIARRTGGLEELLRDYQHLLIDDHSPEGYAEGIATLMNQPRQWGVKLNDQFQASNNAALTSALYKRLACSQFDLRGRVQAPN